MVTARRHRIIQAQRTQRTARHNHGRLLRVQAQVTASLRTVRFTVQVGNLILHRHTHQGCTRERSIRERHTGELRKRTTQAVRQTGLRIRLMNHHGNLSAQRRQVRRRAHVAAHANNHVCICFFEDAAGLRQATKELSGESQSGTVNATRERCTRNELNIETSCRNQLGFHLIRSAQHQNLSVRFKITNRTRNREHRINMTGGATTGEDYRGRLLRHRSFSQHIGTASFYAIAPVQKSAPAIELQLNSEGFILYSAHIHHG